MLSRKYDCIDALTRAGIAYPDAVALRRISMTLHRWHELECGDSNDHLSVALVRGRRDKATKAFVYAGDGTPWQETHYHRGGHTAPVYYPMPDRERGANKRLQKILKNYPGYSAYVQGDPRGCALYILRPGDIPEGSDVSSYYSRGIAVCK